MLKVLIQLWRISLQDEGPGPVSFHSRKRNNGITSHEPVADNGPRPVWFYLDKGAKPVLFYSDEGLEPATDANSADSGQNLLCTSIPAVLCFHKFDIVKLAVSASSKIGGPAGTGLPSSWRGGYLYHRLLSFRRFLVIEVPL